MTMAFISRELWGFVFGGLSGDVASLELVGLCDLPASARTRLEATLWNNFVGRSSQASLENADDSWQRPYKMADRIVSYCRKWWFGGTHDLTGMETLAIRTQPSARHRVRIVLETYQASYQGTEHLSTPVLATPQDFQSFSRSHSRFAINLVIG
jgi:hypothetical protein